MDSRRGEYRRCIDEEKHSHAPSTQSNCDQRKTYITKAHVFSTEQLILEVSLFQWLHRTRGNVECALGIYK